MKNTEGRMPVLAAYLLFACAAVVAARFGWRLGADQIDRTVMATVCAVAAFLALIMLHAANTHFRERRYFAGLGGLIVWVAAIAVDMTGAVGYSAANRVENAGAAKLATVSYQDIRLDVDDKARTVADLEKKLGWIPQHRPIETVENAIKGHETSKRFLTTAQCTDATARRSRSYCADWRQLLAEKAAAVEARTVEAELKTARDDLETARDFAANQSPESSTADSQSLVLASIATLNRTPGEDAVWWTNVGLSVLLAILLLCAGITYDVGKSLRLPPKGRLARPLPAVSGGTSVPVMPAMAYLPEAPVEVPAAAPEPQAEPLAAKTESEDDNLLIRLARRGGIPLPGLADIAVMPRHLIPSAHLFGGRQTVEVVA